MPKDVLANVYSQFWAPAVVGVAITAFNGLSDKLFPSDKDLTEVTRWVRQYLVSRRAGRLKNLMETITPSADGAPAGNGGTERYEEFIAQCDRCGRAIRFVDRANRGLTCGRGLIFWLGVTQIGVMVTGLVASGSAVKMWALVLAGAVLVAQIIVCGYSQNLKQRLFGMQSGDEYIEGSNK